MVENSKDAKLNNLLLLLNTTNLVFSLGIKLLKLLPDIALPFSQKTDLTKLKLSTVETLKLKNPEWHIIEKDLLWAKEGGHRIITIYDADYPELLKEIPDPPLVLFVKGDSELLKSPQLAIVGSRNPTPIGLEIARSFSGSLVQSGLVITSGFAAGIDAASHRGAIAAVGKTIAVMGTGLNHLYPSHHSILAKEIVASGGVLLSEFPLDAEAKAWHFPLRNRIISGLSFGTLVVEATRRSGSLITARLAGEQGREVFAIPGSIYNQASCGCHYLIRQGAKLVEQPLDILEEFPEFILSRQEQMIVASNSKIKNKLDCEHNKLLDCMGFEVTTVDVLASRINLPVSCVSIMLLELEMQGLVQAVMGGYIPIVKK
jgi:DNA processing protein